MPLLFGKYELRPFCCLNRGLAYLLSSLAILYYLLPSTLFVWISLTLISVHILPQLRPYIVAISSMGFWYFSDLTVGVFSSPSLIDTYPINRLLIPTILIFLLFCYGFIFFKINQHYRLLYLLTSYILIYPILLDHSQTNILLVYISIFFKSYLFWIAVIHRKTVSGFKGLIFTISTALPFFAVNVSSPIIDDRPDCSPESQIHRDQLTPIQKTGFNLLFFSLLALCFITAIDYSIFGVNSSKINLSDYLPSLQLHGFKNGLSEASRQNTEWWMRWTSFIFIFINYYLKVGYNFGVAVSIARLAGYPMPAMFNSPWKAKSFAEFYGRMIHYYSFFLMTVLYPTFRNLFSFIKNAYIKTYLNLWLSVFCGGFVFHFTNELFVLTDSQSLYETMVSFAQGAWVYFAIIATLTCLSLYLRRFNFRIQLVYFKPIIYLITGSLIFSIYHIRGSLNVSWNDYFEYMTGLIPGL